MPICEWCGKRFDKDFDSDTFEIETILCYQNLRKCLCAECAIQAIHDEVDGVYYETCERCGKTFDLIEDMGKFDSKFPWYNGTRLRDHWNTEILCADCAIDDVEKLPTY